MAYSLSWLPEILRSAGLKVAEQPGWLTRGRGNMGTVQGVICHHTVGGRSGNIPSLGVLTNGRRLDNGKMLPGPLAQLGLGRDGTYYVIAAGLANHAGAGSWKNITTGNSSFVGIEAENSGGVNDEWPEVQMDAYYRGVAAILRKIDADASMCCGHKEYAPERKPFDPRFDMEAFRARVAAVMAGKAIVRPLVPAADPATGRPTLRRGARGEAVKVVQRKLGAADDGVFGPVTEARIRQFQRHNGLVPDGIVGPKTWALIEAA
ncbi:MAG TPA: N-acetylmuramoyl-L-alanine amidase [Allosphingosinicella sp.]|nr:N-acetylmuramoyl-L-alanine amidase [Allosphingosinicella sp.]